MHNHPMKHAYLIIAHHEFDILSKLVQAIDDERNDIFIHFDKKIKNCPSLIAYWLLRTIHIPLQSANNVPIGYLLFF